MNRFLEELKDMTTEEWWQTFLEDQRKTKMSSNALNALKPSFSSSSFFDLSTHPTIEDQVVLCRQIARQLVCDETNAKSKGREMFLGRVEKSSKWVTQAQDDSSEHSFHETTISSGRPNLKLLLDPRHVQDMTSLDFDCNETEQVRQRERGQSLSREIFSDLTSPDVMGNRGNALFHKRQVESSSWVVDNECDVTACTSDGPVLPLLPVLTSGEPKYRFRDFNRRAVPFCSRQ